MGLKKEAAEFPLQSSVDGRMLTQSAQGKGNLKGTIQEYSSRLLCPSKTRRKQEALCKRSNLPLLRALLNFYLS